MLHTVAQFFSQFNIFSEISVYVNLRLLNIENKYPKNIGSLTTKYLSSFFIYKCKCQNNNVHFCLSNHVHFH